MSTKMVLSERVINQVVTHQFDSAHDALKNNNSVELSGFCKFLFNNKKAETKLKKITDVKTSYERMLKEDDGSMPLKRSNFIKSKLSEINLEIATLKPKIEKNNDQD